MGTSFLALDTIACSSRDYLPKRNTKIKKKLKNHKILQKNKLVVPERKHLKIKLLPHSKYLTNQDASSYSTRSRCLWWPSNCCSCPSSRSPADCCSCCSTSSSSTASCCPTARSW